MFVLGFLSYQEPCNTFMNGPIKQMLNLSSDIEWSFINDDIYNSLLGDLIRPVTNTSMYQIYSEFGLLLFIFMF